MREVREAREVKGVKEVRGGLRRCRLVAARMTLELEAFCNSSDGHFCLALSAGAGCIIIGVHVDCIYVSCHMRHHDATKQF